jgi:hypothetical protein
MERTWTLEQFHDGYPMTVKQHTYVINRLYEKRREWSSEEEQRYQLHIDLRDHVKDKYHLWPADPYAEEN